MSDRAKQYLGDGVFVADWQDGLVLTTDNGLKTTNTIYLTREVFFQLLVFANRRFRFLAQPPPDED